MPATRVIEISDKMAKEVVEAISTRLGCDHTDAPEYPEGRKDVCAVRCTVENGSTYGYDIIYVLWSRPKTGEIVFKKIASSEDTKDYVFIRSVAVEPHEILVVTIGSMGGLSGKPWERTERVPLRF